MFAAIPLLLTVLLLASPAAPHRRKGRGGHHRKPRPCYLEFKDGHFKLHRDPDTAQVNLWRSDGALPQPAPLLLLGVGGSELTRGHWGNGRDRQLMGVLEANVSLPAARYTLEVCRKLTDHRAECDWWRCAASSRCCWYIDQTSTIELPSGLPLS